MRVAAEADRLAFDGLRITFQRTLRIPDDGREYPLPPGLGVFPIVRAAQYLHRLSGTRIGPDDFLIPMYQREALWLGFDNDWPPVAISVAAGTINAVSGRPAASRPSANPQDYVVAPEQVWLDGINSGAGSVRQFVAMPLGRGYTVEHAITGAETHGGIQIVVWPPKPGVRLERPQRQTVAPRARRSSAQMGIAAGGRIRQKIYPDPYGVDVWDTDHPGHAAVHIVNSEAYREITDRIPPETPIDAATYTAHGLPWFEWYEEHDADVEAPESLKHAKTIAERDRELGEDAGDRSLDVKDTQVTKLRRESGGR